MKKMILMILCAIIFTGCTANKANFQLLSDFEDLFTFEYSGEVTEKCEKESEQLGTETMYSSQKTIGKAGNVSFIIEYLDANVLTMAEYNGSDIASMKNMLDQRYSYFTDYKLEDAAISGNAQGFIASFSDPFDADERKMFLYAKNPKTDEYAVITLSYKKGDMNEAQAWMDHAVETFAWK